MALPELGFGNSCNISKSKECINTSNTFFPLQITTVTKLVSTALELNYGCFSCGNNQHVFLFCKIIALRVFYLNFAKQLQLFLVTS